MEAFDFSAISILQDSQTAVWGSASAPTAPLVAVGKAPTQSNLCIPEGYHLFLHRPKTPSSFPRVLIPLNLAKSLEKLLRRRLVLEFPTIYVLKVAPEDLPDSFMLEKDYLYATTTAHLGKIRILRCMMEVRPVVRRIPRVRRAAAAPIMTVMWRKGRYPNKSSLMNDTLDEKVFLS